MVGNKWSSFQIFLIIEVVFYLQLVEYCTAEFLDVKWRCIEAMLKEYSDFRSFQYLFWNTILTILYVVEILKDLSWDTLATRRKTARLSFMYKLTHNLIDFSAKNHLNQTTK